MMGKCLVGNVYLEKKWCSGTKIWVKYDILALQANSTPAQIEVESYSKNDTRVALGVSSKRIIKSRITAAKIG